MGLEATEGFGGSSESQKPLIENWLRNWAINGKRQRRLLREANGAGRSQSSPSFHSLRHSFNSAMAKRRCFIGTQAETDRPCQRKMNAQYTHHELDELRVYPLLQSWMLARSNVETRPHFCFPPLFLQHKRNRGKERGDCDNTIRRKGRTPKRGLGLSQNQHYTEYNNADFPPR